MKVSTPKPLKRDKPSAQWAMNTLIEQLDGIDRTQEKDGIYLSAYDVYRVIKEIQESI
jgi:hypothetical protein